MGTKLFQIRYTDKDDDCCPVFTWRTRAYSVEHAEERFFDSDDTGWKLISVERVKEEG